MKKCSRGRLLKVGIGRHSNQFARGSPIKSLTSSHTSHKGNDNDTSSNSSVEYDGTLDPGVWSDLYDDAKYDGHKTASNVMRPNIDDLKHYGVDDSYSSSTSDKDDDDVTFPLVSDMLMRPYRINQAYHHDAMTDGELEEMMNPANDVGEINKLLGNSKQFLSSRTISTNKVDFHGTKLGYSRYGNEIMSPARTGQFISSCRNLLMARNNAKNLSDREQLAIARGHFCLMVLRRWAKLASKQAVFRRILLKFFATQALKHWIKVNNHMKLGERFLQNMLKMMYGKTFRHWNAVRLGAKAAQIMQLCAGNHLKIVFNCWCQYMRLCESQNIFANQFGEKQLLKRLIGRWKFKVGAWKMFGKCMTKFRFAKEANYFDRWRLMTEWLKFCDRFAGTAVERATKHAYMRWAGRRWLENVNRRKKFRKLLMRLFKSGEKGLLTWGFYKLKLDGSERRKRAQLGPRKPGHCRCVYALLHGGHCHCSFDVHFAKRMATFNSLANSTDKVAYQRARMDSVFEKDYDAGLCVEVDKSHDETMLNRSYDLGLGGGVEGAPQWDQNGRRITPKKNTTRKLAWSTTKKNPRTTMKSMALKSPRRVQIKQEKQQQFAHTTLESINKLLESSFLLGEREGKEHNADSTITNTIEIH